MDHFIGIDAGGTTWDAALVNRDNKILARHKFEGLNVRGANPNVVAFKVKDILEYMSYKGGLMAYHITLIVLAAAGAGDDKTREAVEKSCHSVFPNNPVKVVTDAEAALCGAFRGEPGIVLIAGTGSIAYGIDTQGAAGRAGGYGHLLGDEGSGFWIGREAVRTALDAHYRGEASALGKLICEKWELKDITYAPGQIYSSEFPAKMMAEIAPLVFKLAETGDSEAERIVSAAGRELGKLVMTLGESLNFGERIKVSFCGGLSHYREALEPGILDSIKGGNYDLVEAALEPAVGAVILGRGREGK